MENLKDKTVCVVSPGMYMKIAERLARDFKTVYYHNPFYRTTFPKFTDNAIGDGLLETEGVQKINNFWDYIDEIDLFVFPDCGFSDWSDYLKSIGKRVWASGKADQLELERTETLEYLKELGLSIPKYVEVTGLTNLRKYLKTHENVFVKCNVFRGTFETFHSENIDLITPLLDKLEGELSIIKDTMEFSVFEPIEGVEVGFDSYVVDGQYPSNIVYGVEIKDCGWCGHVKPVKKVYAPVMELMDKIAPTLKLNGYANFISTEMRVDRSGAYLTDFCCRMPSPVSEVYYELITNFSDILWHGGNGDFIEPEYAADYAMTLVITSDWATEHGQAVYFPKEISKWVKLRNYTIVDDIYYVLPDLSDKDNCIGVVVAIGNSLEDCAKKINGYADKIKGYRIKVTCAIVGDMQKEIEKGEEYNIKF